MIRIPLFAANRLEFDFVATTKYKNSWKNVETRCEKYIEYNTQKHTSKNTILHHISYINKFS